MSNKENSKKNQVTLKDVAAQAGVSVATVSHVVNKTKPVSDKLKKKIESSIKELHYKPNFFAQQTRKQHTGRMLGLIIPDIRNPYFSEVIRGAEDLAFKEKYSLLVCNSDNDKNKWNNYVEMLWKKGVDGLIITGGWMEPEEAHELLTSKEIPAVLINYHTDEKNIDVVGVDRYKGGVLIGKYFYESGHRHIGIIHGNEAPPAQKMFQASLGCEEFLSRKDVTIQKTSILDQHTMEMGFQAGQQLVSANKNVTAVFCENDLIALGAVKAINALGLRVPEDISVAGADNIAIGNFLFPTLTTIDLSRYEVGASAVRMVLDRTSSYGMDQRRLILRPELLLRESTRGIF